jgi:hypothetical protein
MFPIQQSSQIHNDSVVYLHLSTVHVNLVFFGPPHSQPLPRECAENIHLSDISPTMILYSI